MKRVVIVSARRTPFGRFRGAFAEYSPTDLAVAAGEAVLHGIDRSLIDQVMLGNVLSAGHGMNIARQTAVRLNLPVETTAFTINMMCGSGMQSALQAVTAIRAGEANAVLAGGAESMSQSALLVARPAKGHAPDFRAAVDSMQRDGLADSFSDRHMGDQAESLAAEFSISREQQDAFAERSQRQYGIASAAGLFDDEIVPFGRLSADAHPRPTVTQAELAILSPAFARTDHCKSATVTAGNSSGINDGAAMLLLAERQFAVTRNWPILAEWVDGIVVGCDPDRMGLGPVHAINALMLRTKHAWEHVDTLEINEAFASQTLACLQQLQLSLDLSAGDQSVEAGCGHRMAFNDEGGAIAIGHPLAASGARLLTHLAWRIAHGRSRTAIGSLCIGGGMGIAALLKSAESL